MPAPGSRLWGATGVPAWVVHGGAAPRAPREHETGRDRERPAGLRVEVAHNGGAALLPGNDGERGEIGAHDDVAEADLPVRGGQGAGNLVPDVPAEGGG